MRINSVELTVEPAPGETLLHTLRQTLRLTGTKPGCGVGECGACTVLIDGEPQLACITFTARVEGSVQTIESLREESRDLREAFADEGAFQCGFCTPGHVTLATALLRSGLPASDLELRRQISGNICRCTGYAAIIRALRNCEARRAAS